MGASHPVYRACTPCFANAILISGTAKNTAWDMHQDSGEVWIVGQRATRIGVPFMTKTMKVVTCRSKKDQNEVYESI